jgi:transposase-like protein
MSKSVLAAAHFHDEAAAFAYLEKKLWPNGPVCPRVDADGVVCEGEGYALNGVKDKKGRERLGLKKCRKCRSQFTLRIGTIFEDSHAPLHIWLQAIALMAASKKGISSNQLSRVLGVQLKTAWHMSHRIRMAMAPARGSLPPMGGEGKVVEVDETYQGKASQQPEFKTSGRDFKYKGKRSNRKGQKQPGWMSRRPVVALVERGGSARTFHVAEANAETVARIIRENVDRKSKLHTDGAHMYRKVGKEFAEHKYVDHSLDEYVRYEDGGVVHNNSAESYFSVFKRGMKGVYQHCSEKHLHRYLAEFDFRHNTRTALGMDDVQRADKLITQVVGKRLTYRTTGRPA